jgi:plastocyanin
MLAGLAPARGSEGAVARFRIVDTDGNPLEDAVVSVHPEEVANSPEKPESELEPQSVEVVQVDQMFVPFVTVIPVGTTVAFPNRDTVQHHVYSLSKARRFEIPLHGGEADERVTFDQPGVVTVGCNIHDWMVSYVVVVATPHFAKSEEDGLARLVGLPAGRHRVEVWHPRLANVWRSGLEVAPDASPETVDVVLKLRPDRRQKSAPESRRKRY